MISRIRVRCASERRSPYLRITFASLASTAAWSADGKPGAGGVSCARSPAATGLRAGARSRVAVAGAVDRRLLLRSSGGGAAIHAAAGFGDPAGQTVVAHGFGTRRRTAIAAGFLSGRPRHAGAPTAR